MSLQGTFDVLGFTDVVNLLARKRETGRLRVRGPGVATDFYFENGRLTAADDGESQSPTSEREARARVEEACFEILAHERGTFEFQPGPTTHWTVGLIATVERVLAEATRRLEEWRQIEAAIPTMDPRPRVVAELAGDKVTIDAASWRLLVSVDGRRNLHALSRKLGLSRFEARRLLKGLMDLGLLEIDADQPRASIPHLPGDEIIKRGGVRFARRPKDGEEGDAGDPDGGSGDGTSDGAAARTPTDARAKGEPGGDGGTEADATSAEVPADAPADPRAGKKSTGVVRIESRRGRPPAPEPG